MFTTYGALIGLAVAIVLIVRKVTPAYALVFGALLGGLIGGGGLVQTVDAMIGGTKTMMPSVLRILASGVLVGALVKTGSAAKIADAIVSRLGTRFALAAVALATMIVCAVGVFIDISVITVAPVALAVGRKANIPVPALLLAMIGGGKAGNVISPNPNTIAAADAFKVELTSLMGANVIPALCAFIATVLLAQFLARRASLGGISNFKFQISKGSGESGSDGESGNDGESESDGDAGRGASGISDFKFQISKGGADSGNGGDAGRGASGISDFKSQISKGCGESGNGGDAGCGASGISDFKFQISKGSGESGNGGDAGRGASGISDFKSQISKGGEVDGVEAGSGEVDGVEAGSSESQSEICNLKSEIPAEPQPSLLQAVAGPIVVVLLLALRPLFGIAVDPLIALPVGGLVSILACGQWRETVADAEFGLGKVTGVAILLIGTGTIAGIVKGSGLNADMIALLNALHLPTVALAPVSGILMAGATASTTAGATIAAQTFSGALLAAGVPALAAAAMIHAGATVIDSLPHGSFFHATGGSVFMSVRDRLKLIPYEAAVGLVTTVVSVALSVVR